MLAAAGEGPFTPKASLIRYWKTQIGSGLPQPPQFLLSKASPMSPVESASFAKLAAENAIQDKLPSFCSAGHLLCFPETQTQTQTAPAGLSSRRQSNTTAATAFQNYATRNFTDYGKSKLAHTNSFATYSAEVNLPVDSFAGYSRDAAASLDSFRSYARDANVVSDSFSGYASGSTGGRGEFEAYNENVNFPDDHFTAYSADSNGHQQSFAAYNQETNSGPGADFRGYGKKGNAAADGFSNYAGGSNVVGSGFTSYGEGGNAPNDTFTSYSRDANVPKNTFSNYARNTNAASVGFSSYREQANTGGDDFKSYAKESTSAEVEFTNYGKSLGDGTDGFSQYGEGAGGQSIGFAGYAKAENTAFKGYAKTGVSFVQYTNKTSSNSSSSSSGMATTSRSRGAVKTRWVEPGKFFRESMLATGNVMPFPDIRDKMPARSFLPRSVASKLPQLSTSKLGELKRAFKADDNSSMAGIISGAVVECERAPSAGETKRCVGSAEDMIDFAVSVLGRNVVVRTTQNVEGSNRDVMIGGVTRINGGKVTESVSCHQSLYPYLLYYCHSVPRVRGYEADILDAGSRAKINHGVAICHLDTSAWSASHGAFAALGSGPGKIEVCHWIFENDMTWRRAD